MMSLFKAGEAYRMPVDKLNEFLYVPSYLLLSDKILWLKYLRLQFVIGIIPLSSNSSAGCFLY